MSNKDFTIRLGELQNKLASSLAHKDGHFQLLIGLTNDKINEINNNYPKDVVRRILKSFEYMKGKTLAEQWEVIHEALTTLHENKLIGECQEIIAKFSEEEMALTILRTENNAYQNNKTNTHQRFQSIMLLLSTALSISAFAKFIWSMPNKYNQREVNLDVKTIEYHGNSIPAITVCFKNKYILTRFSYCGEEVMDESSDINFQRYCLQPPVFPHDSATQISNSYKSFKRMSTQTALIVNSETFPMEQIPENCFTIHFSSAEYQSSTLIFEHVDIKNEVVQFLVRAKNVMPDYSLPTYLAWNRVNTLTIEIDQCTINDQVRFCQIAVPVFRFKYFRVFTPNIHAWIHFAVSTASRKVVLLLIFVISVFLIASKMSTHLFSYKARREVSLERSLEARYNRIPFEQGEHLSIYIVWE